MNRKQLILLLAFLAVIGGAGLVLFKRNKESWTVPGAKMGDKLLPNFPFNEVAAIHLKGGSELNVARKNDVWRVQERSDYPANFHQISDLLIKLKTIKVVEAETVGPADLARVNLEEPGKGMASGTLVEFKDGQGKVLEALLLGKKHMKESTSPLGNSAADGRYILLQSNPREVLLISDGLTSLEPMSQQWLSRDFFKVEKPKSVSLAATNAASSWKLARETESAPWLLAAPGPGEVLDTNKIAMGVNALDYPLFVDVAPSAAPARNGLDRPLVVTIETFDHFTYTLKIGTKLPDEKYPMTVAVTADIPTGRVAGKDEKPEDKKKLDQEFQDNAKKLQDKLKQEQALAPWVYMMNPWILDPLLRDRAQLLEGKPEQKAVDAGQAPKPADPAASPFLVHP